MLGGFVEITSTGFDSLVGKELACCEVPVMDILDSAGVPGVGRHSRWRNAHRGRQQPPR